MITKSATQHQSPDRLLLYAITQAQSEYAENRDAHSVFNHLLTTLLELTESEYGFIGEVLHGPEGAPFLKTHAITNIAWNLETQRLYEENAARGMEFTNLDNLFGAVITTGQAVMTNDPASDPRSAGVPKGHPTLNTFLGLPFFSGATLIGMVGIANRRDGYDDELIEFLNPFLATCSSILVALRTEVEQRRAEKLLRESEAHGRAILENAIDAIITIDESGIIESCNPATSRLFGFENDELVGSNVSMLMPQPHRVQHDQYIRDYLQTGLAKVIGKGRQVAGMRKDGSVFAMELAVNQLQLDGRKLFVGVLSDVSEREASEQRLRQLNSELTQRIDDLNKLAHDNQLLHEFGGFLQNCISEPEVFRVLETYIQDFFPDYTGAFYALTPDAGAECVFHWGDHSDEIECIFPKHDCWALRRGEPHVVDHHGLVCAHSEGISSHSSACIPVMSQDGLVGLFAVYWSAQGSSPEQALALGEKNRSTLMAIADRFGAALASVRLRERLQDESIRDPLTGLFNRRFMDDFLHRELRRAKRSRSRFSVVMCDIDHFKQLNDEHGHEFGDRVLRQIAATMTREHRSEDIVCRFGGEEFIMLLPGASLQSAGQRADQIRTQIKNLILQAPSGKEVYVTLSFGVAAYPQNGSQPAELLASVDKALYASKEMGRDCVTLAGAHTYSVASTS